jgi:[ribosomal protein S5]-alanine N-acetyltransferase
MPSSRSWGATIDRSTSPDRLGTLIGWPVRLVDRELTLRPLHTRDSAAWREVRSRNSDWLKLWDATVPSSANQKATTFPQLVRRLRRMARQGTAMPFAIDVSGVFAGQLTVNNIVRGSAQFASMGYWIDQDFAGRGLMPRAVALATDHCFFTAGLHRMEIAVRPENTNSLRVVEKLGLREIGYAPKYLHINGDWRDHRIFAITVDECPDGLLAHLTR